MNISLANCERFLVVAVLMLLGAVGAGVAAETEGGGEGSVTVKVSTLVREVLEGNPELVFYRAEVDVARGGGEVATSWSSPQVTTTVGQHRLTAGDVTAEGLAWSVGVQQTFEWPGRMMLRRAIADREVELAELGLAQFRAALEARVRGLAYGLYAAQEKAAAAREVALRFEALREVMVQRDAAGLTPLLETRIIEATELTLKRRASEAALEMESMVLELNQLRGGAWTRGVRVEPLGLTFGEVPAMEDLLASVRTNNFELRMRRVELEQQGFEVSLVKKGVYAGWSVGPYFSDQRAGDHEQQVGISLSLPLPLWGGHGARAEVAEARRQQAATSLRVTERDVERRVVEAVMRYRVKLLEMSKWRGDAVEEFRRAAEVADRHYRLGAVPVATYVELQKQYLEAVEALLDTRLEALEAAQRVWHLTGVDLGAVRFEEGVERD